MKFSVFALFSEEFSTSSSIRATVESVYGRETSTRSSPLVLIQPLITSSPSCTPRRPLSPVRAEAETLFSEIAETAAGTRPKEIRIGFRQADADSLKESKSLPELLADADPVLFVGYIASSDKGFSDDEIHDIIAEIVSRDICVDLYFNYQDDYVYQVRCDGVVIDKATGKDGGALREQIPYEL